MLAEDDGDRGQLRDLVARRPADGATLRRAEDVAAGAARGPVVDELIARRARRQTTTVARMAGLGTARDAANAERRLRAAGFPTPKSLEEFALAQSSVPRPTYDYLASLEWVRASENLCLVGPAGTGKSHLLIALGHAAVSAGHRVRYLTAAELIELLYRGLADNSVGKQIAALLHCELVIVDEVGLAPLDATGTQLLFRLVAGAYERRSLAIASHWPFEDWGRFLPEQTTAVSLLDRLLHHATVVVTEGESYRMKEARSRRTTPKKKDE